MRSWRRSAGCTPMPPNAKQEQYIRRLVAGVADHAAELDDYIARYAQGWRFERIPLMASAVMRVAMYEILYMPDIPHGVAISEAVQIARQVRVRRGGEIHQRHSGQLPAGRGQGLTHHRQSRCACSACTVFCERRKRWKARSIPYRRSTASSKTCIDGIPQLSGIYIRGELSNYKIYPSGHHYFTLKDGEGALRCVMFKGSATKLAVPAGERDAGHRLRPHQRVPTGRGLSALLLPSCRRTAWGICMWPLSS